MASHGISRTTEAGPRSEETKKKELKAIEEYKELVELVNLKIQERQYTTEVLHLTSTLLTKNPEYYTIWNYRRLILRHQFFEETEKSKKPKPLSTEEESSDPTPSSIHRLLTSDLQFPLPLLLKFPKCYWIWNHRLWLLKSSTSLLPAAKSLQLWNAELALVSKMLVRDSRNFLGWGYRRVVVAALESRELNGRGKEGVKEERKAEGRGEEKVGGKGTSMAQEEFEYTTRMIKTNMSNFSAWHQRSKLIPRLMNEKGASEEERRGVLDSELKWILEALYTDPYDQSIWFYHQNLMCTFDPKFASETMAPSLTNEKRSIYVQKEIENILELLEVVDDCKWIYQSLIQLALTHKSLVGKWPPQAEQQMGNWMTELRKLDPLREGRWDDLSKYLQVQVEL